MKITSTGRTHVGMKRSHNEDCLKIYRDENLMVVADGMGGHSSGEVASELSAETLLAFYRSSALDQEMTWPYKYNYTQSYQENRLRVGIELSNYKLYSSMAQDYNLKGMGTTMVAVAFYEDSCSIGHVGDSRVYRWRDGKLQQMTEDHSLLNDYIKMRPEGMTPEEIEAFPHKNIIVRALGMKESVQVDVSTEKLRVGDLYLLCSDGLSGMITDADMNQIISEAIKKKMSLDLICERLIQEANKNGGTDNITVLLALVEDQQSSDQLAEDIAPSWNQDPLPQEDTPETKEVSALEIQQALLKAELKDQLKEKDLDLDLENGKTLNLQPKEEHSSLETSTLETSSLDTHTVQDDMPTINESMPQISASDMPTLKLKTPDPVLLKTSPIDLSSTLQEAISPLAVDPPLAVDSPVVSSDIPTSSDQTQDEISSAITETEGLTLQKS